jgi:2-phospho-L-lactate guanylyltransferase
MAGPSWRFSTEKEMVVIIPAKPLHQAKTRLSPALSSNQRVHLSRSLLRRTIRLARQVGEVVVISRDRAVRQLAKQAGAWALVEAEQELNAAIRQAAQWVMARGGQAVLILPADLPLLTSTNLTDIVSLGQQEPAVVIAPCRRQQGTNALLLRPPGLIPFAFGENSFEKHQQAARLIGLEPIIYHSPTIAFDIDLPEDLAELSEGRFVWPENFGDECVKPPAA